MLVARIEGKCKELGTNFCQLEKALKLGNGTIHRWDVSPPSYDKIVRVANMLNVSINWLITGKEDSCLSDPEQQLITYYRSADSRGKRIIMRTAELESRELKSSAFKIGLTETDEEVRENI